MSWILLPLIFLPFGITTPIDQYFQTESPPSLDGSAQGADGGLNFQPAWNNPSLVASTINLDPSAYVMHLQSWDQPASRTNSCSSAINTPGLSDPEISSKQPYILADTDVRPTEFGNPPANYVGRGPPTPLNSHIPLWGFGRYDGYPQRDSVDLRDPTTFLTKYNKQPQLTCATSGKTLYCCFPGEIMCEACGFDFFRLLFPRFPRRKFYPLRGGEENHYPPPPPPRKKNDLHANTFTDRERYPKCIPRQQLCCSSVDFVSFPNRPPYFLPPSLP